MAGILAHSQTNFYVTTTNETGPGSISEAIIMANQNPGKDSILFNIPGTPPHAIYMNVGFPEILDAVVVDGSSQPANGFTGRSPKIIITAPQCFCGIEFSAFMINARACEVYGIYFSDVYSVNMQYAYGTAIYVKGDSCVIGSQEKPNYFGICEEAINIHADSVYIRHNFIGLDTSHAPSFIWEGISAIDSGSRSVLYIENNVIGGGGTEIQVGYANYQQSFPAYTDVIVQGNMLGISDDTLNPVVLNNNMNGGTSAAFFGVSGLLFGGDQPGEGNIVAGNFSGLQMSDCIAQVYGNKFGTNYYGTDTISNYWYGINIVNPQLHPPASYSYTIGGTGPGQPNLFGGKRIGIKSWENVNPIVIRGNYFGVTDGITPLFLENGLDFEYAPATLIDSNVFSVQNKAISIQRGDSAVISYNKFGLNILSDTVACNTGIYLQQSQHNLISNNIVTNCSGEAISLAFADSNEIRENLLYSNEHNAVFLATSNKVSISHNSIYDNETGIQLQYGLVNWSNDSLLPPIILFTSPDSAGGITVPYGIVELYYSLPSDLLPQGKDFIGVDTADGSGIWKFAGAITDPGNVTATVTDTLGNTSEFAERITTQRNEFEEQEIYLAVWPNPAKDVINISIGPATGTGYSASVFDVAGRKIKAIDFAGNSASIETASLIDGIYFLELIDESNDRMHAKLIIRR